MGIEGFVVVSGLPGVGKTTLARPLAVELGVPLISKDVIKEAMADTLGLGDDAWSQKLGGAAFEVLYALAADCSEAVLETAWHPRSVPELVALGRPMVEVLVRCPEDEWRRRLSERQRHAIHREVIDPTMLDRLTYEEPTRLGIGPLLEIDATSSFDVVAVARWARDHLIAPTLG